MKKLILAVALTLGLSACTVAQPDAGEEAVFVAKPILFGHGGVVDTPVKTGLSYAAFSTGKVYVNVKPAEYHVRFDDLQTRDGVPIDFDATLVLQVTDSVKLVRDFGAYPTSEQDTRPVWYTANVDAAFRELVRQAVRKHGMNEIAIDTSAIAAVDNEVTAGLEAYIKASKLPVKIVRITVGKANPPEAVKNQRIETAQQEQKVISEGKRELAEIGRKKAEQARAEADNAYRVQMNLSPEQFVDLARSENEKIACIAAKGGCTIIKGGAGGVLVGAK